MRCCSPVDSAIYSMCTTLYIILVGTSYNHEIKKLVVLGYATYVDRIRLIIVNIGEIIGIATQGTHLGGAFLVVTRGVGEQGGEGEWVGEEVGEGVSGVDEEVSYSLDHVQDILNVIPSLRHGNGTLRSSSTLYYAY